MTDATETNQILLDFFRALADRDRLRIAAALVERGRTAEALATDLGLGRPAITRHLALLLELGIVRAGGGGPTQTYQFDLDALHALRRAALARADHLPESTADLAEDRRKVLRAFLDGERLKSIPVDQHKRLIVLDWLVSQFERDVRYPEREVNEIIKRHHPDSAALRRELVDRRLMQREAGIYWRIDESPA